MGKYATPVFALVSGVGMILFSGILYEWFMAAVAPGLPEYLHGDRHPLKLNVFLPFVLLYAVATIGLIIFGVGAIIFRSSETQS